MTNIETFVSTLKGNNALREGDQVESGKIDRIRPETADEWPASLHQSVTDTLNKAGIKQPYQHQVDAINRALSGADIVMESPTASGKPLPSWRPCWTSWYAIKTLML